MTCFTTGTLIETPTGPVAVQALKAGDAVVTRDNGAQAVRNVSRKHLSGRFLLDNPHLRPVMVAKGALADQLPAYDTMISPNTRVPIGSAKGGFMGRRREELCAIKNLINFDGIEPIDTIGTEYFLLVLDKHQIVSANSVWVENFHPTDPSLKWQGNAQRLEIHEVFPQFRAARAVVHTAYKP